MKRALWVEHIGEVPGGVWWAMARWAPFRLTAAHVRYDDGALLVVSKPPGLAVHATVDPARPHLDGAVQAYLQANHRRAAALHHRLDVATSGLVLFGLDPALNAALTEMFRTHAVDKRYRAVVRPTDASPPKRWRVENFLGKDRRSKASRYTAVRSGGKKAITEFSALEKHPQGVLLEARPVTGRAHQIRVHCAEAGWPIVGDTFYDGASHSRLLLQAWALRFPHPLTGAEVVVEDVFDF